MDTNPKKDSNNEDENPQNDEPNRLDIQFTPVPENDAGRSLSRGETSASQPHLSSAKESPAPEPYALHTLCKEGTAESIYHFLRKHGNQDVNELDKHGFAPIHYSMRRDSDDVEEILQMLYKHDVDTNIRTFQEGDTCLHIIAKRLGEEESIIICLTLLYMGADPGYRNDKYRTPYDIAVARNMMKLADYLEADLSTGAAKNELEKYRQINYGPKLVKAVIDGNKKQIGFALKAGADPNFINKHGAASIHYTITHCPLDKMEVLKILVETGADVNLQDYEGDTALNLVIKTTELRRYNEMFDLAHKLLEWGSDYTLRDLDGKDAYILAKENNYDDILSVLSGNNQRPVEQRGNPMSSQTSLRSNLSFLSDENPQNHVRSPGGNMGQFTPEPIHDDTSDKNVKTSNSNPIQPSRNNPSQPNRNAPAPSSLASSNKKDADNRLPSRANSRRSNKSTRPIRNEPSNNENSNEASNSNDTKEIENI